MVKRTLGEIEPPIGVLDELRERAQREDLLDVAQGAPAYATAPSIVQRIREVASDPNGAKYTDGRGLPALREELARDLSQDYSAQLSTENVLISSGSNQAFCLAVSALAEPGDEVIVTVPYYFNHDMWIRLDGLRPIYVDTSSTTGQVAVEDVARKVTKRTRMIVVTSPGNPTGVTASSEVLEELANLARDKQLVLVLDETYRTFRPNPNVPAHGLFQRSDWTEYLVSLHSFSKDFAIPGYRVGALVGSSLLLGEAMKLMDCVAICAPRIGQEAALEALRSAGEWRVGRATEARIKLDRFRQIMAGSPGGFDLSLSGGFYGWVAHPDSTSGTPAVIRRLALECGVLAISGTVFTPEDRGFIRVGFANIESDQIDELARRLAGY